MKTKLCALLLALCAIFSLSACGGDATPSEEETENPILQNEDGIRFQLIEDTYAVVGYKGTKTEVTVPAVFEGVAVTALASDAFYGNAKITAVSLPASITEISPFALAACQSLTSLSVAADNPVYQSKGNCIIKGDVLITTCPGSDLSVLTVTEIGDYAFYGATDSKIVLPATVKKIGRYAFAFTTAQQVSLPEGLETVEDGAFYFARNLTALALPASLSSFKQDSFAYGTSLQSITVAEGNTTYTAKDNCLIRIADKTLVMGCAKSKIPSDGSVTKIGPAAFAGAVSLESITIPASVTEIGKNAFYATALTRAYFEVNRWYVSADDGAVIGTAIDTKNLLSETGRPMSSEQVVVYNARLLREGYAQMKWFTK